MKVHAVERAYESYWKLQGLYELYNMYETDIKNNVPSFLKFYKILTEEKYHKKN